MAQALTLDSLALDSQSAQSFAREQQAHKLALQFGRNATSCQFNKGVKTWLQHDSSAAVRYVESSGYVLVAGEPLCAAESLASTTISFESQMHEHGFKTCYFAVGKSFFQELQEFQRCKPLSTVSSTPPDFSAVPLGVQPLWHLPSIDAANLIHSSKWLKSALRRTSAHGVRIRELERTNRASPFELSEVQNVRTLHQCWRAHHSLPPMHFLVDEPRWDALQHWRVFVAESTGASLSPQRPTLLGFALVIPLPERRGWYVERIVRAPDAPNGLAGTLVYEVLRQCAAEGAELLTLGLSPLAKHSAEQTPIPSWLRGLFNVARANDALPKPLYNFSGLERFKSRLQPTSWEPLYAVCPDHAFTPNTLLAIARAFAGGSLMRFLMQTLLYHADRI